MDLRRLPAWSDVMDVVPAKLTPNRRWAIAHMMLFGVFWAAYLAISRFLPRGHSIFEVLWWRYALHVFLYLCREGR
jgi:hypothetical protein